MSRLLVSEPSKEFKDAVPSTSVMTERNRLMSWDSAAQGLTKPVVVIPSSKITIFLRPLGFVINITKLIFASLVKLPYTSFKLGYEMAKLFTRGLSSIRRLLSSSREER
jgi:hypothetical protein